jgi:hypothetical protein
MSKEDEVQGSINPQKSRKNLMEFQKVSPKTIFFVSSAIVFLSYIKPIFSVWAYSDEYDFFEAVPKLGKHLARDGNLISSLLYNNFSAPLINSVEDLWRLRVLSFLCLFLILNHVSTQILVYNQSRSIQFLLPIALTLPAPMTFISWALIWHGSFAMLIAYIANIFWLKPSTKLKYISVILLWSSILMSPVAAFSIFGFHAAIFILVRIKAVNFLKTTINLVTLYGISGIASLFTLFVSQKFYGLELNERAGPASISDLPAKIYWLVSRPVVLSTRFFDISSPSQVNAVFTLFLVLSFLIYGFVIQSKNLKENLFLRVALFFTLILLSITPIIVTWSNQIEFRYILGPSVAFFLATVVLTMDVVKRHMNFLKYLYPTAILIISILGISNMNNHTNSQFIAPYKSKSSFIQSEILECQKTSQLFEKIIIQEPKNGYPSRNNIGIFSQTTDLASPWVPIPTVKYILKSYEFFPKEIVLQAYIDPSGANSCTIDLDKYSQQLKVKSMKSGS